MATNQELRQASFRVIGSTAGPYEQDILAAIAVEDATITGTFNERLLRWLNGRLLVTHTSLPAAMQAFAVSKGVNNWDSLGTFA